MKEKFITVIRNNGNPDGAQITIPNVIKKLMSLNTGDTVEISIDDRFNRKHDE